MTIKEKIDSKSKLIFHDDDLGMTNMISTKDAEKIIQEALEKQRQLCYHRFYDDGSQYNVVQAILFAPEPELE